MIARGRAAAVTRVSAPSEKHCRDCSSTAELPGAPAEPLLSSRELSGGSSHWAPGLQAYLADYHPKEGAWSSRLLAAEADITVERTQSRLQALVVDYHEPHLRPRQGATTKRCHIPCACWDLGSDFYHTYPGTQ